MRKKHADIVNELIPDSDIGIKKHADVNAAKRMIMGVQEWLGGGVNLDDETAGAFDASWDNIESILYDAATELEQDPSFVSVSTELRTTLENHGEDEKLLGRALEMIFGHILELEDLGQAR
ncbi:hypothetical protein KKH23_07725 [Patescibacteria group bacterium]|nr:hypothetical protein [Patescibacteria group bacterium]